MSQVEIAEKAQIGAANSPVIRATTGNRPARKDQRSAVTNGKRLHVVRPGDSAWSRRWRDILSEIISDMGREGLSEGQRQLARRAATICIQCERMEGEAAAGRAIDLDAYGQLTDRLGRCFARLGLRRRAKPVPSMAEYLQSLPQQPVDENDDDSL